MQWHSKLLENFRPSCCRHTEVWGIFHGWWHHFPEFRLVSRWWFLFGFIFPPSWAHTATACSRWYPNLFRSAGLVFGRLHGPILLWISWQLQQSQYHCCRNPPVALSPPSSLFLLTCMWILVWTGPNVGQAIKRAKRGWTQRAEQALQSGNAEKRTHSSGWHCCALSTKLWDCQRCWQMSHTHLSADDRNVYCE